MNDILTVTKPYVIHCFIGVQGYVFMSIKQGVRGCEVTTRIKSPQGCTSCLLSQFLIIIQVSTY